MMRQSYGDDVELSPAMLEDMGLAVQSKRHDSQPECSVGEGCVPSTILHSRCTWAVPFANFRSIPLDGCKYSRLQPLSNPSRLQRAEEVSSAAVHSLKSCSYSYGPLLLYVRIPMRFFTKRLSPHTFKIVRCQFEVPSSRVARASGSPKAVLGSGLGFSHTNVLSVC